jgi:eukaryotic-like serine/threonine-protein kinase
VVEPARAPHPDFKPHLFGKFFLLQRLAVGGMAEIYRAKVVGAAGFEKELALKRILPSRSQDQGFIKMLVNEAKLTAQLTHSNIAQIYECGVVEGTYFIAMELVYGVSMKEMMATFARAGTTLSPEQAIFIVLQLLHGLDYAHRKVDAEGAPLRIVHCDVSPDNALVSWEGEVKLLDFGIARAAAGLSNYKEGMLMGKLGYVAPEQASIEKTWDHRVDLFAAGIILYELLTKQKPFPKATDVDSLVASRKAKVAPPSVLDDRIPAELDAILARALAYDPEKRYPSARAFADALVDVLFPTPHSAVQELLGQQMQQVFAERILRQRAARSHDALVVKVLQNVLEKQATAAAAPPKVVHAPALMPIAELDVDLDVLRTPGARGLARPRPVQVRRGIAPWKAAALALVLAGMAGAGTWAAELWLRPGVLVVTSDPPGAQVTVDGRAVPTTTPAVVEGVDLSRPVAVAVSARDRKSVTIPVQPEIGKLVRRVHAQLPAALGSIVVESDPPGAEVQLDELPAGVTPLTIQNVRLDERHRLDLTLPGHELDQFVFLPEKDGQRFIRTLAPATVRRAVRSRDARE